MFALVLFPSFSGVPPAAAGYLQDTLPHNFSITELRAVLEESPASSWSSTGLTVLYWLAMFFVSFLFIVIGVFGTRIMTGLGGTYYPYYRRGTLVTADLIDGLMRYRRSPNRLQKRRLRRLVREFRPNIFISPLFRRWVKLPEYQWFQYSMLAQEARKIVFALNHFQSAVRTAVTDNLCLDQVEHPLRLLHTFFVSVGERADGFDALDTSADGASELELLEKFAGAARPIIIKTRQAERRRPKKEGVLQRLQGIIHSPALRFAGLLSLMSGLTMLIGVVMFGISLRDAFLTWFAVVFGSVSISLGAGAFRQPQAEDENGENG